MNDMLLSAAMVLARPLSKFFSITSELILGFRCGDLEGDDPGVVFLSGDMESLGAFRTPNRVRHSIVGRSGDCINKERNLS